eukprot:g597.t1
MRGKKGRLTALERRALKREDEERIRKENLQMAKQKQSIEGRNDVKLSDEVLKKREQLKEESQREMEERARRDAEEAKRLANMKETIEGRNDVKLSDDVLKK